MGETRAKKTSKRSLKAQNESNGKSSIADMSRPHQSLVKMSRQTSLSSLRPSVIMKDAESFGDRRLTEAREVEGRGVGLFAVRTIPRGTLVLAEIPSIRVTGIEEADDGNAEILFQQKFETMPKADRKHFLKLHDSQKANFSRVRSIYHTNCYNLARPRSELGGSCMGLQASRINHSCAGVNVQFSFLERIPPRLLQRLSNQHEAESEGVDDAGKRGVMLFYAVKKIQRGHEILSNYESAYLTSQQRQIIMQFHYGFTCDCKACMPGNNPYWMKSDARRRELTQCRTELISLETSWRAGHCNSAPHAFSGAQLDKRSPKTLDMSCQSGAMIVLLRIVELLELEGLVGIDLVNAYHKLVKWSRRGGEKDNVEAEKWARLEKEAIVAVFGPYSSRSHDVVVEP